MKYSILLTLLLSLPLFAEKRPDKPQRVNLSKNIFAPEAYSDLYIEDGALVRMVNYHAVNEIKDQLASIYDIDKSKFEDRGEAHITLITPPEYDGRFHDGNGLNNIFSPQEIHNLFKNDIQNTSFDILCIGEEYRSDDHRVFFLVVDSPDLFSMRQFLKESFDRDNEASDGTLLYPSHFNPLDYYPHITIAYVKDDIYGVTKDSRKCQRLESGELELNLVYY